MTRQKTRIVRRICIVSTACPSMVIKSPTVRLWPKGTRFWLVTRHCCTQTTILTAEIAPWPITKSEGSGYIERGVTHTYVLLRIEGSKRYREFQIGRRSYTMTKKKLVKGLWSKSEVALLRKLFPSNPTAKVAERLGRSLDTVKKKASRMGL